METTVNSDHATLGPLLIWFIRQELHGWGRYTTINRYSSDYLKEGIPYSI